MREVDEGAFQPGNVMTIGVHMVDVDIGDDGHHRQQIQERSVGLIRFHHDVITLPQAGIGTGRIQAATDHKGGI